MRFYAFDFGMYNANKITNMKVFVNQAQKEDLVFFKEDYFDEKEPKAWEIRYDNSYPNVFYDPFEKIYRCYYATFTKDDWCEKFSLQERINHNYKPTEGRIVSLCYAESEDGIHWKKPNLEITEFQGSKKNNIIRHFLHGASVMLDLYEKDENKRYKMFTMLDYSNGSKYLAVAFSKDGIHFSDFIKCPNFSPRADTHNFVIFDEKIKKYVLTTREWQGSHRIACMSFSDDFIHWSMPIPILPARGYENQVYSMPFFKSEDYLIGLASMFHEGDTDSADFDTVDVEMTYCYRYSGWNYVDCNTPFIPRGKGNYKDIENKAFDCGCIFSCAPVEIGEKLYFYYMGGNGQHTNFREGALSRAYIPKHRFAYIAQKDADREAQVYTNPFSFQSGEIFIDADIEEQGYLTIELYDRGFEKINVDVRLEKMDAFTYKLLFSQEPFSICKLCRLKLNFKGVKLYSFFGDLDLFRMENDNNLLMFK